MSTDSSKVKPLLSTDPAKVKPLLPTQATSVKEVEDKTTSSETPQQAKKKKSKLKNKTSEPSAQDIAYCSVSDTSHTVAQKHVFFPQNCMQLAVMLPSLLKQCSGSIKNTVWLVKSIIPADCEGFPSEDGTVRLKVTWQVAAK